MLHVLLLNRNAFVGGSAEIDSIIYHGFYTTNPTATDYWKE